ncbi:MAG: class I SAM-dependent methyltransferase, partial [Chloroflexi bacterium]|nr:class I SAM-dependent methyltransferase [Chloroflexota bacterium]
MKPLDTYKRLCTEFYDLDKPEAPTKALDYYLRHLKAEAGPVLEPMSGSGRFLAPLLERGIDVDGVDASPHMLQACRDRCARKGLIPVLYQQFLQELSLPRRYGFMFIPAGSFGLILDSHEAADSLKRLYDYLLPGGKLLLEIQTPQLQSQAQGTWTGRWHVRPDGAKLVISLLSKYDP